VGLEDGAVNRAHAAVDLGVGVRVVKGDQTGYGYTEDLSRPALLECARTAAAIADGPSRPAPVALHVTGGLPDRYPLVRPWDEVRPEEKLPVLSALNARAFAADPRVRKVNVYLRDESGAVLVADSAGRIVEDRLPMTVLSLSVLAEDGSRREQNGYNVAGRAGFEFYTPERLDRVVREAVARTAILFEAGTPPAGEMPVVLAAGSSGILLHEAIGHGMEADFNRKGVSIYADKIGKRIAQPFVSIVDDAANAGARGAINVDDEGNAAGTTRLVEGGVLATYLHDAISARHYGVAPTGNGRRESYRHPPLPRMRSTYMLPGPHRTEEIIRSVKRGIFCQNFSNGQVHIGAGDFTFYVKNGYLIEDGRLTRPVKDVNIIGNGPDALLKVDMVSDDLAIDEGGWTCGKDGQSVPVSQGLPTVRVSSMTVGGRGS
jgi:TldD protein